MKHMSSKHTDTSERIKSEDLQDANDDVKMEEGMSKCMLCGFISSESELSEHIVTHHVIPKMELDV